jgi:inosose dehydratase
MAGSSPSADGESRTGLGVSPLSWVNEVLEDLGRDTSAEACLTEAAAAGYDGVELTNPPRLYLTSRRRTGRARA